jgi:general L-amino acid transport system permease protein
MSQRTRTFTAEHHAPVPLWRDVRVLQVAAQAVFVVFVVMLGAWLVSNLLDALKTLGLNLSFGFMQRTAGFRVSEGPTLVRSDPYWRAYFVGVINSVRVISIGLVLTTVLGVVTGVAQLSTNWLVRTLVKVYIEVFRNTPLLVQLFFWYFAVILKMPSLEDSIVLPGPVYISQRGVFIPWPEPTRGFGPWLAFVAIGLGLAVAAFVWRYRRKMSTGQNSYAALVAAVPLLSLPLLGWFAVPERPFLVSTPMFEGFNVAGGTTLTPEFAALLFGLVVYTAAFIADIVRAGIQAVPKGQVEAARSLGLSNFDVMRMVVLPQALRVIIPPLGNQYLNLAKNSSLAIGVGYPDLYAISNTIFNQSGQAVQVIALVMGTYLVMSLLISAFMNFINARLKIVER